MYLIKLVPVLFNGELHIVVEIRNNVPVELWLFGWVMEPVWPPFRGSCLITDKTRFVLTILHVCACPLIGILDIPHSTTPY